ncbi:hypothetical protein [Chryseobacterium caseinilyticum]|uniref:C1q domain-containing protein n=1 Tax=Chryseobacterium caseinilyticum TaxID=2771428 RepID=A0ABR8ZF15_9FLAO|nr:hypothetical protein [Chryseobacterium caseinilyticum]MBD8083882.1 hypothetical protein [Chryseobacterium caseinilyticum]
MTIKKILVSLCAVFSTVAFSQTGSVGINTSTPDNSALLHIENFEGVPATAVATISGGAVTSVTVTNGGSGYKTIPTINFLGGGAILNGGTKATATATVTAGVITAITVNNGGSRYTGVPTVTVSGGNKGLLLPRLNLTNLNSLTTPVSAPADGLLAYNGGVNSNRQTLHYFDSSPSVNRWQAAIDADDTPKIAFVGFTGNHSGLNNATQGISFELLVNNPTISPFSNIAGFKIINNTSGSYSLVLPQGNYLVELKLNLNSPPADNPVPNNPPTAPLSGSDFYLMGYFVDFYPETYNNTTGTITAVPRNRKEIPVLSKVNVNHYASWSYVCNVPANANVNIMSALRLRLGRMQGSTFYDLVNVIPSGSFIRITKL